MWDPEWFEDWTLHLSHAVGIWLLYIHDLLLQTLTNESLSPLDEVYTFMLQFNTSLWKKFFTCNSSKGLSEKSLHSVKYMRMFTKPFLCGCVKETYKTKF
jgi:hypothetical protein